MDAHDLAFDVAGELTTYGSSAVSTLVSLSPQIEATRPWADRGPPVS